MTIAFDHLVYRYPSAAAPALTTDALEVADGEFCLVAGPSAGGKSTLLRTVNGLIPQFHGGTISGSVRVRGVDPVRTPAREMARLAGMVFQEPEAQGVTDIVEEEIAFAMEQHGIEPGEMRRRLDSLLESLGIEHLRKRRLVTLSGGERQRVAIASVLALEPSILLLDEPTSQLDPDGAAAVLCAVQALHRARGLTVLIAEHRLERLLPVADSVLEVSSGHTRLMTPRDAAGQLAAVPAVCELARRFGSRPIPLTVAEARAMLPHDLKARAGDSCAPGDMMLRLDGVTVSYGVFTALRQATFEVRQGEIIALVGPNGSGKSTLFRAIAGLNELAGGTIGFGEARPHPPAPSPGVREKGGPPTSVQERTAFAALVPQDPALALYHDTVRQEVADTLRHRRLPPERTGYAMDVWGIAGLAEMNPRDLSVGQQQRVAIAAMLPYEPPVWLLDEPTRGADADARAWLAARLRVHASGGGAAIVATHDIESAAAYATRVIALESGEIRFDLPARDAFGSDGPMATQTALLVRGAITPFEVVR